MVALPENNTDRLFVDYTTGTAITGRIHTFTVRYNAAVASLTTVQGRVLLLLQAYGAANFRANWRVIGVRNQAQGTNFSVPVTLDTNLQAFVGTATTPTYNARFETVEWAPQGRSLTSGRRVRFSVYHALTDAPGDFRFTSATLSQVTAVKNTLDAAAGLGVFLAIDGTAPTWAPYVNAQYNSYWETRSRGV